MRRYLMALLFGVSMLPMPALVGCDRDLEHTKTVEQKDNGTTVTKENKTTESPNGTVTHTEEKHVDKPANP